jgi:CheY-like chemotaxis protein
MNIRVLVADDDAFILRCYQRAFEGSAPPGGNVALESLSEELFGPDGETFRQPTFDLVACSQGQVAVEQVTAAVTGGKPFDVVVLDVRMPPGINGIEAGARIRALDRDVPIIFVTGYSDVARDELERRIPPASKLHYFSKPLSFSDLAIEVGRIVGDARGE